MTVLNGQGLVGTIASVNATTSTVLLSTDASVTVGVRLAGHGEIGVVSGTGKSMSGNGLLRLQVFDVNAVLRPGQQLVTFGSGAAAHPMSPGSRCGVITRVEGSATSLTKLALVRPYADDTALGVVGVVIVPPKVEPAVRCPAAVTDPGPEGHRHGDRGARYPPLRGRDTNARRHRIGGLTCCGARRCPAACC